MKAALRDPSPFRKPDLYTERKYHAWVGESAVPACNLAHILDPATVVDAASVHPDSQCKRDACEMAFTTAGARS